MENTPAQVAAKIYTRYIGKYSAVQKETSNYGYVKGVEDTSCTIILKVVTGQ